MYKREEWGEYGSRRQEGRRKRVEGEGGGKWKREGERLEEVVEGRREANGVGEGRKDIGWMMVEWCI